MLHTFITFSWILLKMGNIFNKICTFYIRYPFSENHPVLWDNVEKYCTARQATDENIKLGVSTECWISEATDSHSEYVILTAFLQQWLNKRTLRLCYTHSPYLVVFKYHKKYVTTSNVHTT